MNIKTTLQLLLCTLSLALAGCDNSNQSGTGAEPPHAETTGAHAETTGAHAEVKAVEEHAHGHEPSHAHKGAKPGSHEDWCGAHQVPESQCTRCNPTLVAAFKATGDWCEEHALPESQCLSCNPDLKIVRPPKTERASE